MPVPVTSFRAFSVFIQRRLGIKLWEMQPRITLSLGASLLVGADKMQRPTDVNSVLDLERPVCPLFPVTGQPAR